MDKVVFIPKCERCGSVFKTKQNLVKHLTKKQECQPLLSSKERDECLQYVKDFEAIHSRGDTKCSYCNRSFQHRSNMYKHRKICKKRPKETEPTIQDLVREEVEKIKKEMLETLEQIRLQHTPSPPPPVIQQQSNCNNTTNICIQTQMNAFGHESITHISQNFLNQCVRRTNKGFIDLLEKLHFDPSIKENANLRITNKKMPLIEVNDGTRWKFDHKDNVLNQMLDKGHEILQEHLDDYSDEIKRNYSESMYEYIIKWFEKVADRDKITIEKLLTDIYILILNNS